MPLTPNEAQRSSGLRREFGFGVYFVEWHKEPMGLRPKAELNPHTPWRTHSSDRRKVHMEAKTRTLTVAPDISGESGLKSQPGLGECLTHSNEPGFIAPVACDEPGSQSILVIVLQTGFQLCLR